MMTVFEMRRIRPIEEVKGYDPTKRMHRIYWKLAVYEGFRLNGLLR